MQPKFPYFEDLNVGDQSPALVLDEVTRTHIVRYAGASGDFNPIHHDEVFARNAGLPGVFAMGMFTAGFLSHLVSDWLGLENIRRYKVRFTERVWPGDKLVAQGRIVRKDPRDGTVEARFSVTNQHGQSVLEALAVAILPFRHGDTGVNHGLER